MTPTHRISLLAALLACGLPLTGCLISPDSAAETPARLRLNLSLERPAAEGMRLASLHVTLVPASGGDTLRDVITDEGGSLSGTGVVLNSPRRQGQVITPRYDLPRGGAWTYAVESRDARDSVIHEVRGVFVAAPGEPLDLPLSLAARYASYEAHLLSGAVTKAAGASTRLELSLDGAVIHSAPLRAGAVNLEYLPTGPRRARWRLYGAPRADGREPLLYEGEKSVTISATGPAEDFNLRAVTTEAGDGALGKTAGDEETENGAGLALRFGRTGTVVMSVTVPAEVML